MKRQVGKTTQDLSGRAGACGFILRTMDRLGGFVNGQVYEGWCGAGRVKRQRGMALFWF